VNEDYQSIQTVYGYMGVRDQGKKTDRKREKWEGDVSELRREERLRQRDCLPVYAINVNFHFH